MEIQRIRTKRSLLNAVPVAVGYFLCLLLATTAHIFGQTSGSISFQGALNGSDGKPLPDGSYNLTFRLFDRVVGGTALGTSSVTNVPVLGGLASTQIPVETLWFNGAAAGYMGVAVNDGPELSPRIQVTSVPYAIRAEQLGGKQVYLTSASECVVDVKKIFLTAPFVEIGNRQDGQPTELRITGPNTPAGDNYRSELNFQFLNAGSARVAAYRGGERDTYLEFMTQQANTPGDRIRMTIDSVGRVGIGTQTPKADLDVAGRTRTQVLEITGGSDIAEPFDVSAPTSGSVGTPQAGMVLVIDRDHDGKLVPCSQPYDSAVAGVISGANELAPGLVMRADGRKLANGEHPLAMTGRVWCWAEADGESGGGSIRRGDRLTTSSTVGHAMKAGDAARAPGAVIGKALTELSHGRGLVLVLVNLQ